MASVTVLVSAGVTIKSMRRTNPSPAGTRRAWHARWAGISAAMVSLVAAGCGVPVSGNNGFPTPPQRSPVDTALVSVNGRVITAVAGRACGNVPRLVARYRPGKVTLVWVYPKMTCHAETTRDVTVRITLPKPLGTRTLAHPSGGAIPYFSQRDFARVTFLPAGYRLASELPAGQPAGDKRTYTVVPGATGSESSCPCPPLVIWQQVIVKEFIPPTKETTQQPTYVNVNGHRAALLSQGSFFARSVNWAEHGYYFTVAAAYGTYAASLTNAQLIAIANGLRVVPATS